MEGGDYDKSLEKVWEDYIVEMDSLKEEILSYLEVHGEELYEEQQELKEKVWEHREEISHLKERIMQLDKLLSNSKPA